MVSSYYHGHASTSVAERGLLPRPSRCFVAMATKLRTWNMARLRVKNTRKESSRVGITFVGISCTIGGGDCHQPGIYRTPWNTHSDGAGFPTSRRLRKRPRQHLTLTFLQGKRMQIRVCIIMYMSCGKELFITLLDQCKGA